MEDLLTNAYPRVPLAEVLKRSYSGKRVLITGHNGFVGTWLSYILVQAGAQVIGFSLPQRPDGIAELIGLDQICEGIVGDIRDLSSLNKLYRAKAPEVVFHLAAQPLVLPSFLDPVETFSTNVMGTANVLEAMRGDADVKACVVITSDKCYAVSSQPHGESDPFGGDDPYSASKGAAEIVTNAYRHSFFHRAGVPVASARAGNIIGGGDWGEHRLVPDVIRSINAGDSVRLRRPSAVRPWQHVLDAVIGYVRLGDSLLLRGLENAEGWNFGPRPDCTVTVSELVDSLIGRWRELGGEVKDPVFEADESIVERDYLTLLSSKAETRLGWYPQLDFKSTIYWTAEWYFKSKSNREAREVTDAQIARFLSLDGSPLNEVSGTTGLDR